MGSAGILARDAISDEIQWINIDPCYVYHPLNAYDEGNYIVLDVVRHDRTFVRGQLEGGDDIRMERWTIDPAKERVAVEVISDQSQEFPRVDPRVECHRHRYGYAIDFKIQGNPGGILKHDLETRTTIMHDLGADGASGGRKRFYGLDHRCS